MCQLIKKIALLITELQRWTLKFGGNEAENYYHFSQLVHEISLRGGQIN